MKGEYIDDMVRAFEEAGISNVRNADRGKWSDGMFLDALSVPFENSRDDEQSDLSAIKTGGEQFNLIGHSYGGLQAAQGAIDYADQGGKVDNLVLLATPIEKEFLEKLKNHPNIKEVRIIDLPEQGDPIKAGMSDWEVIKATPKLFSQYGVGVYRNKSGHFFYSDEGKAGIVRRRELAKRLKALGLK